MLPNFSNENRHLVAPGECPQDYITSMTHLETLKQLPDTQIIQAILNGMDSTVQPLILHRDPSSLANLQESFRLMQDSGPAPTITDPGLKDALKEITMQLKSLAAEVNEVRTHPPEKQPPHDNPVPRQHLPKN